MNHRKKRKLLVLNKVLGDLRLSSCALADQEAGSGGTDEGGRPVLMTPAPREKSHLCPLLRSALPQTVP